MSQGGWRRKKRRVKGRKRKVHRGAGIIIARDLFCGAFAKRVMPVNWRIEKPWITKNQERKNNQDQVDGGNWCPGGIARYLWSD